MSMMIKGTAAGRRYRGLLAVMTAVMGVVFLGACSDDDPAKPPVHVHSVASLSVAPAAVALKVGESATLAGEARCGCGAVVDASIAWTSGNTSVATVDASGLLSALSLGTVTVTAAAENRLATVEVVVLPTGTAVGTEGATVVSSDGNVELEIPAGALNALTDVIIEPVAASLFAGDGQYIQGTGYQLRPDGLQLQERARLRIRFDPNQVPSGVFHEQLRIRERDQDQNQWRQTQQNQLREHRVEAEIERFGVYGILFEPAIGTMVGPAGGVVQSADGNLELLIPPGALIEPADITVDKVDDSTFAGDALFVPGTAYDVKPTGLAFAKPAALRIHYDSETLPDGMHADQLRIRERERQQNQWRDPSQCTLQSNYVETSVTQLGMFGILGSGAHVPVPVSIVVSPAVVDFQEGDVFQMTAVVRDEDDNVIDVPVTWSTSNPAVAVVSESGLVTAVAEGSAVISAEVTDGSSGAGSGLKGNAPVNVGPKTQVATVTVVPGNVSVGIGGTMQLTAEVRDADGNLITRSVTWQSSNSSVATVSGGLVTGVAVGSAVITARTQNVSGSANVTVTPPVASVVITDPGNEPLEIGLTRQLTATAYDGSGVPTNWQFTWTSSDATIATVDNTGLVTGVSRGTVTISAAAGTATDAVSIRVVGESEGGEEAGNNLSWPVVFVDGVGLTGLPPATETGLRPLPSENMIVDGLPFWYAGNVADHGAFFTQQSANTWVAEWIDGGGQSAYDAEAYWGDNLASQTWSVTKPIRIEVALSATAESLTGFNMFYLYGEGPDEMQGTDGTTSIFTPTIYTVGSRMIIQRINGPAGTANWTVSDEAIGSEVNVGGRIIYGAQLRLSDYVPPSGTLEGWYRLSFELETGANCRITSVGNTSGTYLPEFNVSSTWIDIYIEP